MSEPFRVTLDPVFREPAFLGDESKMAGLRKLEEEPHIGVKYPERGLKPEHAPSDLAGCDALIAVLVKVTEASLEGVTSLKHIARFGAGFDTVDLDACARHGVVVTNAPLGPTESMAESTLGLMIMLSYKIIEKERVLRGGVFKVPRELTGTEIMEKTVGILGLGNIGCRFAELLAPFHARLIAYDPYVGQERFAQFKAESVDFHTLLRESDYLSIHCPLTDETRYMFGEAEFQMMKPTAYFLNTSRGGFYKDATLAKALSEGWIAGGGIDVFEDELSAEDNPLIELTNCILTPHAVGMSDGMMDGIWKYTLQTVLQTSRGELPDFILNPEALPAEKRAQAKVSPSFIPR